MHLLLTLRMGVLIWRPTILANNYEKHLMNTVKRNYSVRIWFLQITLFPYTSIVTPVNGKLSIHSFCHAYQTKEICED